MTRGIARFAGFICSLLLIPAPANSLACGKLSSSITLLPSLGGSALQVNGLNPAGQLTGFSYTTGDLAAHAFLYSTGVLTDLGTLGGTISQGFAINSSGLVVGQADLSGFNQTHAFLYNGTNLLDLGTLGGSFSGALLINDAGQVAGESLTAGDGMVQAFLYANGSMTNLPDLGGGGTYVAALNQLGQIAGDSLTETFDDHAFLCENGTLLDLGTLGGNYSAAVALNDAGMAVGESSLNSGDIHAFVYTGGAMVDVGTLGGTFSQAVAVNNAGQVIGLATTTDNSQTHGFIYNHSTMTDLGTLGGDYSYANSLNNKGQVVGNAGIGDNSSHAFLWQDGAMLDLNTVLPANSGWELSSAQFINDSGRIVGTGSYNQLYSWFVLDLVSGNAAPVASAGPDRVVECPAILTLDASASRDPDGDMLAYEWSEGGAIFSTDVTVTASFSTGVHTVTLKVTDPCGAFSQTNVAIRVTDATPPSIACPAVILASVGANCQAVVPDVVAQTSASDTCTASAALVLSQIPTAGTGMEPGDHVITVQATDAAGNTAACSTLFRVVDLDPPTIHSAPGPLTLVADANCQAVVPNLLLEVVAADNCTPADRLFRTQSPAAGTTVSVGQHNLTVTVTDAAGNGASTSIQLNVVDGSAPTILSAPGALTLVADANCQAVVPNLLLEVVAADNCTPADRLILTQSPASGTTVSVGQHNVTVTATDATGNGASTSIQLNVVDGTAPSILSAPGPLTLVADANCQAVVPNLLHDVVAADNCTPADRLVRTQSPAAGAAVGLGQFSVTVSVTDASGNTASTSVQLNVVDATAPTILSAPGPLTLTTDSTGHAVVPNVFADVVAADNCTPVNQLVLTQSPAAGTVVGPGQYAITVAATDASGNTSTRAVSCSVVGSSPPAIQSLTASPSVLSPPNHQLVPVSLTVVAFDAADPAPVSKITSVTCNETVAAGDVQITGNLTVTLAASRAPSGNGRVYTITVECRDAAGNIATSSTTVSVPKSKGH